MKCHSSGYRWRCDCSQARACLRPYSSAIPDAPPGVFRPRLSRECRRPKLATTEQGCERLDDAGEGRISSLRTWPEKRVRIR